MRAPSADVWNAMSEPERQREEERILAALDDYREAMSEGTRHSRPKIPTSEELVGRLQKMTDVYQDQLDEAERARNEAVDRFESARAGVAELLLRRLGERGFTLTAEQRLQVTSCADVGRLLRWMEQASSALTVEDVLS